MGGRKMEKNQMIGVAVTAAALFALVIVTTKAGSSSVNLQEIEARECAAEARETALEQREAKLLELEHADLTSEQQLDQQEQHEFTREEQEEGNEEKEYTEEMEEQAKEHALIERMKTEDDAEEKEMKRE